MTNLQKAQAYIASKARAAGEEMFAREVLAGAWDDTNRADIRIVRERLDAGLAADADA